MPHLGRHLISLTLSDSEKIDSLLARPIFLAINISATQFIQEDLVEQFNDIISIGEIHEMMVIAEGVENQEHVDILKSMACHRFQGYFFSKPQPITELTTMLKNNPANPEHIST